MKYLIIGASAAGLSCAKTLRRLDNNGEIVVISKDDMVYSRCMLHYLQILNHCLRSLSQVLIAHLYGELYTPGCNSYILYMLLVLYISSSLIRHLFN